MVLCIALEGVISEKNKSGKRPKRVNLSYGRDEEMSLKYVSTKRTIVKEKKRRGVIEKQQQSKD